MNRITRGSTNTRKVQSVKITPKPKFARQGVDFADLDTGSFFLHQDCLCIKQVGLEQTGLDLTDGDSFRRLSGIYVLPVNVEIKWTRK